MQVTIDILYQTRRNIFLEVLLSFYDETTNWKHYPHFNNKNIIHLHFSNNFKFSYRSKR